MLFANSIRNSIHACTHGHMLTHVPATCICTCVYIHVHKLWAQVCSLSLREPCFWELSADSVRSSMHACTRGMCSHMHSPHASTCVCTYMYVCPSARTHTDADFTYPDLAVIPPGLLHLQRVLLASFHIHVLASPVRTWLRAKPASPHLPTPGMDHGAPSFFNAPPPSSAGFRAGLTPLGGLIPT